MLLLQTQVNNLLLKQNQTSTGKISLESVNQFLKSMSNWIKLANFPKCFGSFVPKPIQKNKNEFIITNNEYHSGIYLYMKGPEPNFRTVEQKHA